ncbi:MAG: hypothetical protein ATN31_00505 [Candidatus Epulonipiscioides saccharophilum]|nr:MAG: hypothetical protein ATN31_00505 [Epulopiscium sp. AS2M-Bin001]
MMRSLFSGVSGLQSHQLKMDVIGNNIANVNTIGFKSQRVTFADVYYQTTQSATTANEMTGLGGMNAMQIGLGTSVSSIDMLMTPGSAQRTDNPFDLMIEDDAMFIVSDATGTYYTRSGAFRVDERGTLVIPNGMRVQGWPANAIGTEIMRGTVGDLKLNTPENNSADPQTTTDVNITGNLNVDDSVNPDGTTNPIYSAIKFYDTVGTQYSMPITLTATTLDAAQGQTTWTVAIPFETLVTPPNPFTTLTDTNGNQYLITPPVMSPNPGTIKFDVNGEIILDGTEEMQFTAINLRTAYVRDPDDPNVAVAAPIIADVGLQNTGGGTLRLDLSLLTQYDSITSLDPNMGTKDFEGAGKAAGTMQGFDIGTDGKVTAYYSNGDIKLLGQVAVTYFDNLAGLEKVADNVFKSTANSGDFDGVGAAGSFATGTLEMSNVDLSKEFTEMITTQRGYQASSKTITTSDEMLQELINLKR